MTDTTTTTTTTTTDAEPTAEELAAVSTIRPLADIPSNWVVKSDFKISAPTLAALSPSEQEVVRQRAGSSDGDAINSALIGYLREKQADARISSGAGAGTTAVEHVVLRQAATVRQLNAEVARIEDELADVREHRTEYENDKPVAVPVYRYTGRARIDRETHVNDIKHQIALIAGIEGEAELMEAARADALRARSIREQIAERQEVQALGEKMLRDERIRAQAESYASFRRSNIS